MNALLIINNFTHDLFTGLWTSSVLVIYLLSRKASALTLLAAELQKIMRTFFWLGLFSLAVIIISGLVRFKYYRPENDGSEKTRKSLLIAKHLLFSAIFSGGTFLAYQWAFS